MIKARHTFKNIILGLALLATMFAYAPKAFAEYSTPDAMCIMADDFGDTLRKDVTVNAIGAGNDVAGNFVRTNNGWLDTGITLLNNVPLQVKTRGIVNLCATNNSTTTNISTINVTDDGWQSTGIHINKFDNYKITASGNYYRWGGATADTDGSMLYVYIGGDDPNNQSDSHWNLSKAGKKQPGDAGYATNMPEFYEVGSEFDFVSIGSDDQPEGILWFRYRDSGTGSWNGSYNNNSGGYDVTFERKFDCVGRNGEFLLGYVGPMAPVSNPNIANNTDFINFHTYVDGNPAADPPLAPGTFNDYTPQAGKLWLKIIDDSSVDWDGGGAVRGDGDYTGYNNGTRIGSNYGSYKISIVTKKNPPSGFSDFINGMISPIRDFLQGTPNASTGVRDGGLTKTMYEGITGNINFVLAVRAAMMLAVVFFAFKYMVGLSNITQKEFFAFTIKMAIVITLIGPTSWQFFNEYLFAFFIEGTDDLIRIMTSQFTAVIKDSGTGVGDGTLVYDQPGDTFAFLNHTVERFFTAETNLKIQALLLTFPVGWIMALLIYLGMGLFIYALLKAFLLYLTAIIMISLLLFVAPIFITFLLFERTKEMFDNWLKNLINFAMQPVLLFTVLGIFNVFILSAFYVMLSYNVCYSCKWIVDFPFSEMVLNLGGNWDKFCLLGGYYPWGLGGDQAPSAKLAKEPVAWFIVLIFIILSNAMLKFIDWVVDVASTMTAGTKAVSMGDAVNTAISEAKSTAKTTKGIATDTAKFAGRNSRRAIDKATGHGASDLAKKGARQFVPRGRIKNAILRGHSGRGEDDGMGGKTRYSRKFMTSSEKRALDRKREAFGKMTSSEQRDFTKAERDRRLERKTLGKAGKARFDKREKQVEKHMGAKGKVADKEAAQMMDERKRRASGYKDASAADRKKMRDSLNVRKDSLLDSVKDRQKEDDKATRGAFLEKTAGWEQDEQRRVDTRERKDLSTLQEVLKRQDAKKGKKGDDDE